MINNRLFGLKPIDGGTLLPSRLPPSDYSRKHPLSCASMTPLTNLNPKSERYHDLVYRRANPWSNDGLKTGHGPLTKYALYSNSMNYGLTAEERTSRAIERFKELRANNPGRDEVNKFMDFFEDEGAQEEIQQITTEEELDEKLRVLRENIERRVPPMADAALREEYIEKVYNERAQEIIERYLEGPKSMSELRNNIRVRAPRLESDPALARQLTELFRRNRTTQQRRDEAGDDFNQQDEQFALTLIPGNPDTLREDGGLVIDERLRLLVERARQMEMRRLMREREMMREVEFDENLERIVEQDQQLQRIVRPRPQDEDEGSPPGGGGAAAPISQSLATAIKQLRDQIKNRLTGNAEFESESVSEMYKDALSRIADGNRTPTDYGIQSRLWQSIRKDHFNDPAYKNVGERDQALARLLLSNTR